MKRIAIFLLLALLLTGCGPEEIGYTLNTAPSTAPTTEPTVAVTAPRQYREYATYPVQHPTDNVDGNRYYGETGQVVSYFDTDLMRRVVLCSQPSCTHSSQDCTAYLGGNAYGTSYVVVGDLAYALIDNFDKNGQIHFVSQNLITGKREILWDLTPEENAIRQGFRLAIDGNTAFLSFAQYELAYQDGQSRNTNDTNYGCAVDLTTGECQLLLEDKIVTLGYYTLGGDELWVDGCTEQYLLVMDTEYHSLPMSPSEYAEQEPYGDYDAYFAANPPESTANLYSIDRTTGERRRICGSIVEAKLVFQGLAFREKTMSFCEGDTLYIYDGRTGNVTPCFTKENICDHQQFDGRIFYTLWEEDGYSWWWYDPHTGEHHHYMEGAELHTCHIEGETTDHFYVYTSSGYRFITKQDWYNENYDAAF